ncbi:helix-turn-helix domain-containing protein [Phenylobacterium sp.]|uniref:helix-turn-helix domain-containing protein n=1 Tax=Phenylobacterium sp. TaxID=1871053 RepID=UPI0025CDE8D4|nr:helix-turn-helix domain-containing protein [Phenylobacterium sp.]
MARQAPHSSIRVAARLANGFALDLVKLGGFGRDVIDGLLMAAISQANVAQITRSPLLQRTYASLDQPPPDELRRPVSISAIANSLRIPFETARRRIAALVEVGIVKATPKGVIIPTAPLNSPFYRMAAEANYALVRNLYFRLRGIGMLDDLPRPNGPPFDPDHPPVRLVIRLSSDYVLRLAEPLSAHVGDLVTGLILMDVIQANTGHMPDSEGGEPDTDWSPAAFVPDSQRRLVRAATLSERLGIPPETVRRHLAQLAKADICERIGDGYRVPARVLAGTAFIQFMVDNESHLHRLYAGLADFSVLSEWEREILALRGAA